MSSKPAPSPRVPMVIDNLNDGAEAAAPLARTPCDVKMTCDFEVGGGSFNRLTNMLNQAEIDDATGVIYFNFKGKKRRMSIHSAAVGALTEV
jgi:hypothetical protein